MFYFHRITFYRRNSGDRAVNHPRPAGGEVRPLPDGRPRCEGQARAGSLPRLSEGALKDQRGVGDALRADVAQQLADCWLAAHLKREVAVRATAANEKIPHC